MRYFIHTEADLETADRACSSRRIRARRRCCRQAGHAGAAPARGGLCRAVRHRLRAAALDRQRRRDLGPAGRGVRSVPPRRGAARARRTGWRGSACRRPKIKTIKAIAKAIAEAHIDLDAVAAMEADEAHAALTALHGIGPWTADIYLLFCLGHADAWPAGDLALQEAARIAFGLRRGPTPRRWEARRSRGGRGAGWRRICCGPTIASVKRREGAPVASQPREPQRRTATRTEARMAG